MVAMARLARTSTSTASPMPAVLPKARAPEYRPIFVALPASSMALRALTSTLPPETTEDRSPTDARVPGAPEPWFMTKTMNDPAAPTVLAAPTEAAMATMGSVAMARTAVSPPLQTVASEAMAAVTFWLVTATITATPTPAPFVEMPIPPARSTVSTSSRAATRTDCAVVPWFVGFTWAKEPMWASVVRLPTTTMNDPPTPRLPVPAPPAMATAENGGVFRLLVPMTGIDAMVLARSGSRSLMMSKLRGARWAVAWTVVAPPALVVVTWAALESMTAEVETFGKTVTAMAAPTA